ncbi:MAG TPA: hypothetical protein VGE07_29800 [Herpetosiphonaceae bacterium]
MRRGLIGLLLVAGLAGCGQPSAVTKMETLNAWLGAVLAGDWTTAKTYMSGDTFGWQDKAEGNFRLAPWTDAQIVAGPQPWAGRGHEVVIRWERPYPKPFLRVRCTRVVIAEDGTIQGDDQFVDCPGAAATP